MNARAEWNAVFSGETYSGQLEIGRGWDELLEAAENYSLKLLEVTDFEGNRVLAASTANGSYLNESNVRRRILAPAIARANERLRLKDRAPIPAVTPHGLRYTFCSLLISQGEDVATVAAQMRHADPTTTLRIYTQVMKHTRHGVAERRPVGGRGRPVSRR